MKFLNEDESILWKGKANIISDFETNFFVIILMNFIVQLILFLNTDFFNSYKYSIAVLILILIMPLSFYMYSFVIDFTNYKNLSYIITNQRLILYKDKIIDWIAIRNLKEIQIYSEEYFWTFNFLTSESKKIQFKFIIEYIKIKKILLNLRQFKIEAKEKKVILRVIKGDD